MPNTYTNQFKGRANRKEKAVHLRTEFERIEDAFRAMASNITGMFNEIFVITTYSTDVVVIDPSDGLLQEVTLPAGSTYTLQLINPVLGNSTMPMRVTVMVHGPNVRIINGWGPQTWKEIGPNEWLWMITGNGANASALFEFWWDGLAWVCLCYTRNKVAAPSVPGVDITEALFPFINDLTDSADQETLTLARASAGSAYDTNENFLLRPADAPRFMGARYPRNWIASASDLQSVAWETSGATVTTEAAAGPSGEDVDRVTFNTVNGELRHWFLPHFGRSSPSSDPIRIAVSMKAKMAVAATGTFRLGVCHMGAEADVTPVAHQRITIAVTDEWRTYAHVFALGSGNTLYDLSIAARRTLTKMMIEAPSGSVGSPVLITDVQVEFLKESDPLTFSEIQDTDIGASMVLTATGSSTGSWNDGTKQMVLDGDEFVDFQNSFEAGKQYLCIARRTAGRSADVYLTEARLFWKAYDANGQQDEGFVQDAAFTFVYAGGQMKFVLTDGTTATYTVNIYEVSGEINSYGTENANTYNATTHVGTLVTGPVVSSKIYVGLGYEKSTSENLIPLGSFRSFNNWTRYGLVTGDDSGGWKSAYRGEYGLDGLPCGGTILQDQRVNVSGYVEKIITIPNDSNLVIFSMYIRKVWNTITDVQIVEPQYDQVTVNPSEYVDVEVALIGGTTTVTGRVRMTLKAASTDQSGFELVRTFDYFKWLFLATHARNNSTGNTQARIRIFPARGDSPTVGDDDATLTGWAIVDWTQLEVGVTTAASPIPGGYTLEPDILSTVMDDGVLRNGNGTVVGDVTSGVFDLDSEGIYRSINYLSTAEDEEEPPEVPATAMHEFGPQEEDCVDSLDDEFGDPILDAFEEGFCSDVVPEPEEFILQVLHAYEVRTTAAGAYAELFIYSENVSPENVGYAEFEACQRHMSVFVGTDTTYCATYPEGFGPGEYLFMAEFKARRTSDPVSVPIYYTNSSGTETALPTEVWHDLYGESDSPDSGYWYIYQKLTGGASGILRSNMWDFWIAEDDGTGNPVEGTEKLIRVRFSVWRENTPNQAYIIENMGHLPSEPLFYADTMNVWDCESLVSWRDDTFSPGGSGLFFYTDGSNWYDDAAYGFDEVEFDYWEDNDILYARYLGAEYVYLAGDDAYLLRVTLVSGDPPDLLQYYSAVVQNYSLDEWVPTFHNYIAHDNVLSGTEKISILDIEITRNLTPDAGETYTPDLDAVRTRRVKMITQSQGGTGAPDLTPPTSTYCD